MSQMKSENNIRFDLQLIASWIEPGARVLDLGCGKGELLAYLKQNKSIIGTGIERREENVSHCIANGLSVLQGDINEEVEDYQDNTFDYVILSQTLQQVYTPAKLIHELLRIGNKVVVSFPNFSHWQSRLHLLFTGHAPQTKELPYEWHDTPNIRVITLKDFRKFIRDFGFVVCKEAAINSSHTDREGDIVTFLPNLRATYGIFLIGKK